LLAHGVLPEPQPKCLVALEARQAVPLPLAAASEGSEPLGAGREVRVACKVDLAGV